MEARRAAAATTASDSPLIERHLHEGLLPRPPFIISTFRLLRGLQAGGSFRLDSSVSLAPTREAT